MTLIAAPHDPGLERARPVGRDHRHAGERKLQRHGARFGECRARNPKCRALFLLADHDPRLHRPALSASATASCRCGMVGRINSNAALGLQQAQRLAEHRHVMPDLAAAASRQNQQNRRRGPGAPAPRCRAAAKRSARSGDGRHSCTADRAACDMLPARTAAAPARDRYSRASRAPGPAATPRPRARHNRQSVSRHRGPGRVSRPGG